MVTSKAETKYLSDWFNAVPARWYGMTIAFLALVGVIVAGAIWLAQHGLDWWWIVSGLIVVLVFVAFSFLAYRKVAIEIDELKERHEPSDTEVKLMEWRKEQRQEHMPTVSKIPEVLLSMWSFARSAVDKKKADRPKDELLAKLFINLLDLSEDDPLLKRCAFNTEKESTKSMKAIASRMDFSLRRPSLEKAAIWRRRIAKEMDNLGFGLQLTAQNEYSNLVSQLELDRNNISQTKIDQTIDVFIENLNAFYNLELLKHYGRDNKGYVFPKLIRDTLREMADVIEKVMRGSYTRVRGALESYAIGGNK